MLIDRHMADYQVWQVLKREAHIVQPHARTDGTPGLCEQEGGPLPPKDGGVNLGLGGVTPGSSQLGRSGIRGEMQAGLDHTAGSHLLTLGGSVRRVLMCSGSPSWRPLATVQRGARMEAGGNVGRLPPRPLHGAGVDGCPEPGTGC